MTSGHQNGVKRLHTRANDILQPYCVASSQLRAAALHRNSRHATLFDPLVGHMRGVMRRYGFRGTSRAAFSSLRLRLPRFGRGSLIASPGSSGSTPTLPPSFTLIFGATTACSEYLSDSLAVWTCPFQWLAGGNERCLDAASWQDRSPLAVLTAAKAVRSTTLRYMMQRVERFLDTSLRNAIRGGHGVDGAGSWGGGGMRMLPVAPVPMSGAASNALRSAACCLSWLQPTSMSRSWPHAIRK